MAIGGKYELTVCCYTASQISLNRTFWMWSGTTGTGPTNAQIAAAFDTHFAATYKGWMSQEALYRGISIRRVATPTEAPFVSVANEGVGTVAGSVLPTQVTGVLSFKTFFAGAHYRGRVYPGFPPTSFQNVLGGMTNAGAVALALISAQYAATVSAGAGGNTASFTLQVRSVVNNVPPLPPTITYNAVQEVLTRNRFATQRRRGQFGRPNTLPF